MLVIPVPWQQATYPMLAIYRARNRQSTFRWLDELQNRATSFSHSEVHALYRKHPAALAKTLLSVDWDGVFAVSEKLGLGSLRAGHNARRL